MLKEFKEFAMRGNAIDMAVGIIIGTAFGKIVSSLVNDIIMPPIGFILGKVDFSRFSITLHAQTATSQAVVIKYGSFINTVIDFLLVSIIIFLMLKQINRLLQSKPTQKTCPYCCSKIAAKATKCPECTADLLTNMSRG